MGYGGVSKEAVAIAVNCRRRRRVQRARLRRGLAESEIGAAQSRVSLNLNQSAVVVRKREGN